MKKIEVSVETYDALVASREGFETIDEVIMRLARHCNDECTDDCCHNKESTVCDANTGKFYGDEKYFSYVFKYAISVYDKHRSRKDGIQAILDTYPKSSRNSASIYCTNIKKMLNGEFYECSMSQLCTETFLKNIKEKFGSEAHEKALKARELHREHRML